MYSPTIDYLLNKFAVFQPPKSDFNSFIVSFVFLK